jgi:hypothetical protein
MFVSAADNDGDNDARVICDRRAHSLLTSLDVSSLVRRAPSPQLFDAVKSVNLTNLLALDKLFSLKALPLFIEILCSSQRLKIPLCKAAIARVVFSSYVAWGDDVELEEEDATNVLTLFNQKPAAANPPSGASSPSNINSKRKKKKRAAERRRGGQR